jgi:hypothetical protein
MTLLRDAEACGVAASVAVGYTFRPSKSSAQVST